ncbi:MAG: hypothetical protein FD147_2592 [Chloroflexi bacterium]|nr:MAG: hypothetical protein FD147_2592 [Chloroflexota bacterium]
MGRIITDHRGQQNGITREALLIELRKQAHLVNTEDRQMRLAIESFRKQGVRICHNENRKVDQATKKVTVTFWYYLAADELEYYEFRARYMKYATSIWQTTKAMDEMKPVLTKEGLVEPPPGIEVQGSLNF